MKWPLLILLMVFVSGCISNSETPRLKTCEEAIAEIPQIIAEAQAAQSAEVTRVVDGDTIELSDSTRIRLIVINTPEKDEMFYAEAKANMENLVLNKQVYLQKDVSDKDKYGRSLRFVFTADRFVNAEQISAGLASSYEYFPDLKYSFLFNCLEKQAKLENLGIWKGYGMYNFSASIKQNPDTSSNPNDEYVVLTNLGDLVDMNGWKMKDEATHIYTFGELELATGSSVRIYSGSGTDTNDTKYWNQKTTVWNNDGDTVFLRDAQGNLALAYEY